MWNTKDQGGGRQPDGKWDSSKCTHPTEAFRRTWLPGRSGGEFEVCNGCGRATGNTR